jgi:Ca-activated chloride channel family protein
MQLHSGASRADKCFHPAAQGDLPVTSTIPSHRLDFFRGYSGVGALVLFCSLAGFSQPSPPPHADASNQAAISSKTALVVLPVRVTDAHGEFVPGLSQENFQVFEDGRQQKLTVFQRGDTPVTVGLIVDHSRSMGPELTAVAAAVSAFAQTSNPQDEMFVVDFNDQVWFQLLDGKPFSNDPAELEKAVSAVTARGRTALYDAVAEGINHLKFGRWDKKALVIVSDGGDNASQHTYSQILALAQRSQTLVYSIGLLGALDQDENPDALRKLCKNTGGLAYFPGSEVNVNDISKQIARDLREQYTLGFAPEDSNNSHSFRKIEVKVTAPGRGKLHARSRPGYFGTQDNPPAAAPGKSAS